MRDINGKQTVVNRPVDFPLESGKSRDLEYREEHPNKTHGFEHWKVKYTVVGPEAVEVPAGRFDALKIEAEGTWEAEVLPTQTIVRNASNTPGDTATVQQVQRTQAHVATGRLYRAIWYVPGVRRWVKSVEEYYGSGGVRNERYTGELESYKLAP